MGIELRSEVVAGVRGFCGATGIFICGQGKDHAECRRGDAISMLNLQGMTTMGSERDLDRGIRFGTSYESSHCLLTPAAGRGMAISATTRPLMLQRRASRGLPPSVPIIAFVRPAICCIYWSRSLAFGSVIAIATLYRILPSYFASLQNCLHLY